MTLPLRIVAGADRRSRDTTRPIVLIGFQEQANLGLGYLASVLRQNGYTVHVFDFEQDASEIQQAVTRLDPILVGFSLIFQFYIDRFRELAARLRSAGVTCHFTIGGHFPSLSYADTLDLLPEVDTVVRFEGEMTLLELADCLSVGASWQEVSGLALRHEGCAELTAPRPLVHDLDSLPYPDRSAGRRTAVLGRPVVPLLASRGCARTCSFCSIHTFYRSAPGKVVRTRKPAAVVEEMVHLHEREGAAIFLFQDDDFPLFGPVWQRWAHEFVDELHRAGLPGRAIWKMNCRADVVEPALFARMRDAGLYLVYMGLESGTEEGLRTLHKQVSVEQNIRAVQILKEQHLLFDFGFMLLDPSSTFDSVRQNLTFLRTIVGDGSAGAVFCRMLPYDGTPIKEQLAREGRLRGDVCNPDYDFLDPRLSAFYDELRSVVDITGWIHGHGALSHQLNWIWNETAVAERLFPRLAGHEAYVQTLREITRKSNALLFGVVDALWQAHVSGTPHDLRPSELRQQCQLFSEELLLTRNGFVARHQELLMACILAANSGTTQAAGA